MNTSEASSTNTLKVYGKRGEGGEGGRRERGENRGEEREEEKRGTNPFPLHSILINCGVRTVNLQLKKRE
jgi:hypothetical protein